MEEKDFPQTIEGCHKLLKQFIEITKTLTIHIDKLEEENKALKELLNNNSSNSSLSPSLDKKKEEKR
ncbi:hypothetical protein [Legionella londiniensis]|uniref:Uncharacterized protein n=1 Tax=Legionella londiniensis TaxID=45068 RepID=A0A0W0VI99_9GAMM|nr:hypothetical protein [Legionella londiniensis]KTD19848.1 hypothetical protein Llon_2020 [Legionella londiniensis]STX93542.1 Uncharacterised protein [Legionella londiniensis]